VLLKIGEGELCPNESVEIVITKNGLPFWTRTYTLDFGDPALGYVSGGQTEILGTGTVVPGDVLSVTAHTLENGNQIVCKREGNFRFEITLLH
jgi:hypothetical protein